MSTPDVNPGVRELTIRDALREALREEMRRDPRVFLLGEDVGRAGGVFKVTEGLIDEFGPARVRDTPIVEAGFTGVAVGAALTGMRPVVELMFGDFTAIAMDQIVNQAAKLHYMTGGQAHVPMVIRTTLGAGRSSAAQHSQSWQAIFAHIPGLRVVLPSTPADAKGLLKTAIRDENPVVFLEDKMSYGQTGPVPTGEYLIPFGQADVKRAGTDLTVVATSSMVPVALQAAEQLQAEGISLEVIDPRTLAPLDMETIIGSVKKTERAVVIDEGCLSFGVTAELAAQIAEHAFFYLDAPVRRIAALDIPVPFSPALEFPSIPDAARVVATVKETLNRL